MSAALRVLAPGLHTTVQDLGRHGVQHLGIPVSGALDPVNLRLANLLAGNAEDAGALEALMLGPSFEVAAESVRVALAGSGARMERVGDAGLAQTGAYEGTVFTKGERFRIITSNRAAACYLAVEGGFAIEPFMGSQSTYVRGGFGGFEGRALREGDQIPLRQSKASARQELMLHAPDIPRQDVFRVMLGPQDDYFDKEALARFLSAEYTISNASDRMGLRLEGPPLRHAKGFDIVSDGIAHGAIQVPGSGQPIILLADRQTTGGYPKIATVISADLPALGRAMPGDQIRFRAVDFDEAVNALTSLRQWFSNLKASIRPVSGQARVDIDALFRENIIGGVIDAGESHSG